MKKSGYPVIEAGDNQGSARPQDQEHVASSVLALEKTYDSLFENAPVMLHSIGADGKLIKVNQKWLEELSYEPDEVLRRNSTDFLTAESRGRAMAVMLPRLWKAGNARSVGLQFEAKKGQALELLLDAERIPDPDGNQEYLAAIYYHDLDQWKLASNTQRVLVRLAETRREMAGILSGGSPQVSSADGPRCEDGAVDGFQLGIESMASFLKAAQAVSANLRALVKTQVELLEDAFEQREEFLKVVTSINDTLSELVSLVADAWPAGR